MEKKIIRLKEVDSTNAFLKNLDTYDEDALTIAVADYQTAGRGQGVHTWESEPGKNLLFSMMMCPKWVPLRQQFLLSEAGALAVKDALDSYTDGITLKWPNDVYWYDKKISGTLIETAIDSKGHCPRIYFSGRKGNYLLVWQRGSDYCLLERLCERRARI